MLPHHSAWSCPADVSETCSVPPISHAGRCQVHQAVPRRDSLHDGVLQPPPSSLELMPRCRFLLALRELERALSPERGHIAAFGF